MHVAESVPLVFSRQPAFCGELGRRWDLMERLARFKPCFVVSPLFLSSYSIFFSGVVGCACC
ncbi:hypothetical protein N657DRAFT_208727 [Parathielavia appendiculata]|uniref:Uncharacterized protein n=1 Tax=Parathielavia appendiculata TaxID=2587402 RepID=A0AAN6Z7E9_9PEZI|nr:hypothetical protein N657DRAFT_208727 [Parathielavia appendiculata]